MGGFKLFSSSIRGLFGDTVTLRYPAEDTERYERTAGNIQNSRPGDCILCGMCQRSCPTGCITVDKKARTWTIDPFGCVTCSSCVRACPKSCLDMFNTHTKAAREKSSITVDIPETERNTRKPRQRAETGES